MWRRWNATERKIVRVGAVNSARRKRSAPALNVLPRQLQSVENGSLLGGSSVERAAKPGFDLQIRC